MLKIQSRLLVSFCLAGGYFVIGCSGGSLAASPSAPATVTVTAPTPPSTAPQITITGPTSVRLGSTVQLSALVNGTPSTAVSWSVDGVRGGMSTAGVVSTTGLYSPPAVLPPAGSETITAVTNTSPVATATITENLLNPTPVITSATVSQAASPTSWTLQLTGKGFLPTSQITVGATGISTSYLSATQLVATVAAVPSGGTLAVAVLNPDPGASSSPTVQVSVAKTSATAAARMLDQATFGPTVDDVQHVQHVGLAEYLSDQFATPPTLLADIANPPPAACSSDLVLCEQSEWWQAALTAPDQLRQRVAFALSEMFVVSSDEISPRAITAYQNILAQDAFSNFATLLRDVTLSPAMGAYLNMLNSRKAGYDQIANENFARELMQLFTTGLYLLNADGSVQVDSGGNPIPVYTETQVEAYARAYTGWTYGIAGGSPATFPNEAANYDSPMGAVESAHDTSSKTLLSGTVLPSGQSAEQDLEGALASIFNHPNVGPFVCKQLIQHLVTSTPSPGYVARIAAVFADDGEGVRGNLKAVMTAILMDSEARAGDAEASFDGGHLREPVLYLTGVLRGLGAANLDPNGYYFNAGFATQTLGEEPYDASSVFNFFPPSYVIPGTTLNAPEFGQENTGTATLRLSLADKIVSNNLSGFWSNLDAYGVFGQIASATGDPLTDSGNLVDELGAIFMHSQMPAQVRSAIVSHVSTLSDISQRVRVATYLVITSSFYKVEH